MRGRLLLAVVAGAAVALSGCGTVLNLAGDDPYIYGGVQKDLAFIQTPRTEPLSGGCGKGGAAFVGLVLADVSLSAIADTLTLPLAVYLRQNERPEPGETGYTGGRGNPGGAAGPPTPGGPNPLGWGDGEGWAPGRKTKRPAEQDRAEAPSKEARPTTPPIIVPPPLSPEQSSGL
jgi:uncharacterized protein YceK